MRRVIDVVIVLASMLVIAPLSCVIALLILTTMGRPVLFRQTRSGRHGKRFEILKFRTMRPPTEAHQADALRQTSVGQFLRRSSLDELPQMWNVLRGEMSLIGPRPTLPEQVAHYTSEQRRRLDVRPGITGWAQVRGRNLLSWPQRIELDVWYIANRTLLLDLWIVALTVLQLVRPRGIVGAGGINRGFPVPSHSDVASQGAQEKDRIHDEPSLPAKTDSTL